MFWFLSAYYNTDVLIQCLSQTTKTASLDIINRVEAIRGKMKWFQALEAIMQTD